MALFGKKSADTEPFLPDSEKANSWFVRARQMAESYNYESAFPFFASGFKLDPRDIDVHHEVLKIATTYYNRGGDPARNSDLKAIDGPTDVEKFVTAIFEWWHDVMNPKLAMKAIAAAVKADLNPFGIAMADTVIRLTQLSTKPPSAKELKSLMELFKSTDAIEQAINIGRAALKVKPEDTVLERELNELAAERALSEGGYENLGSEEGGYRKFVKDIDKQRELEEESSLAGAGGSKERVLERTKQEYEEDPSNSDSIGKYAKVLKQQATKASIKLAFNVLMQGYKDTKQYRFKMEASDLRIKMATQQLEKMVAIAENDPSDENKAQLEKLQSELKTFRKQEYQERAAKYPTDRKIRYQLGELAIEDGDLNLAMECFQKAKDEPRLRVRAGQELGRCFAEEGWYAEAIGEFKESIKALAGAEAETELSLRYDLMQSLAKKAKADSNIELAREAMEICSGIARKDILYRDIRDCRRELDVLAKELD